MKKRIIALLTAGLLIFSMLPTDVMAEVVELQTATELVDEEQPLLGQAAATQDAEMLLPVNDLIAPVAVKIDNSNQVDACQAPDSVYTQSQSSAWDVYRNRYYYNQLTETKQSYWDALNNVVLTYLTTVKNATKAGYTEYVEFEGIDIEEAIEETYMFIRSNPQYYFLQTAISYNEDSSTSGSIAIKLYDKFKNGSNRAAATAQIKEKIEGMLATVEQETTSFAREVKAHDLICDAAEYNYDVLAGDNSITGAEEEQYYTQSAYSTLVLGTTVCNGYAQAYQMLMNAAGINTILVTSAGHAWNEVRMNDSWYHVDCTWDDTSYSGDSCYLYVNRSTEMITGNELDQSRAHVIEASYSSMTPACSIDTGSTKNTVGEPATPTDMVQTPVISLDSTTVTISCATEAAQIYYTTDGTDPSQAATKSDLYTAPFAVANGTTIRAIAACDQYADSEIQELAAKWYTVTFAMNGHGIAPVSQDNLTYGSLVAEPTKPQAQGYLFGGWYTDSTCTNQWSFTTDTVNADLTLYAGWQPVTYSITYNLNGGTQASGQITSYTITTNTFGFKNPTRPGYTFAGWYTTSSYAKKATGISRGTTGNQTVYAKWTKVTVKRAAISKLTNKKSRKLAIAVKKVSGAAGYQIQYATSKKFTSKKTVTVTSTSKTISKLKKNKTYYVRVRAYKKDSKGSKVYGSWSKIKAKKISK